MKWLKERDLLIAQTLAFVQSVAGKTAEKPGVESDAQESSVPPATDAFSNALANVTDIIEPPKTVSASEPPAKDLRPREVYVKIAQLPRGNMPGDYRAEILNRVANFRAHQQRFIREREEYFSSTLAKIHASIDSESARPRLRK